MWSLAALFTTMRGIGALPLRTDLDAGTTGLVVVVATGSGAELLAIFEDEAMGERDGPAIGPDAAFDMADLTGTGPVELA